jgi:hypothetical protein
MYLGLDLVFVGFFLSGLAAMTHRKNIQTRVILRRFGSQKQFRKI